MACIKWPVSLGLLSCHFVELILFTYDIYCPTTSSVISEERCTKIVLECLHGKVERFMCEGGDYESLEGCEEIICRDISDMKVRDYNINMLCLNIC